MSLDEISAALDALEAHLYAAKMPAPVVRQTMGLAARLVGDAISQRSAAAFWRGHLEGVHESMYSPGSN